MKRYRAIQRGYDNVKVREVGEIFESPVILDGWVVEVDDQGEDVEAADGGAGEVQKRKPGRPAKVQDPV